MPSGRPHAGGARSARAPVMVGFRAAVPVPHHELRSPARRGLLLDLGLQRSIWDFILRKRLGLTSLSECSAVLVTDTPFTPATMRREVQEVFFEDLGFSEAWMPALLAAVVHITH